MACIKLCPNRYGNANRRSIAQAAGKLSTCGETQLRKVSEAGLSSSTEQHHPKFSEASASDERPFWLHQRSPARACVRLTAVSVRGGMARDIDRSSRWSASAGSFFSAV